MKHLTITLLTLLMSMGALGGCIEKDEYNAKLDFTFKKLYGTHTCVLDDIMKDDSKTVTLIIVDFLLFAPCGWFSTNSCLPHK